MDSYKLKRIIITTFIVAINVILVSMVFTSVIATLKKQLKEEKQKEISGEVIQEEEIADHDEQIEVEDKDQMETGGDLEINFNKIIKYFKEGRQKVLLSSLQILIGVNLIIISILIIVKTRKE